MAFHLFALYDTYHSIETEPLQWKQNGLALFLIGHYQTSPSPLQELNPTSLNDVKS